MIARVLSDDQIDRIHSASMSILERVGVVVPHGEILATHHVEPVSDDLDAVLRDIFAAARRELLA